MKKHQIVFLLVLLLLIISSLACQINANGQLIPTTTVEVIPTEPSINPEDILKNSIQSSSNNGDFEVILNESQLTSLLTKKLQEQPDQLMTNPQVYLRNNTIEVDGMVHRGFFSSNITLTLNATIDAEGKPQIEVSKANFGSLPIPGGFLDGFSSMLNDTWMSYLENTKGVHLHSITVSDGYLIIRGNQQ